MNSSNESTKVISENYLDPDLVVSAIKESNDEVNSKLLEYGLGKGPNGMSLRDYYAGIILKETTRYVMTNVRGPYAFEESMYAWIPSVCNVSKQLTESLTNINS